MLADYIIRNEVDIPKDIKSFGISDYKFNQELSDDNNYYFIK